MKQFSDYSLHLYTDIVYGKDTESQAGALVKKHGGQKALLVYGGGSIKRSGLYDRVTQSLRLADIPFVELSGVQPNPRRSLVNKGLVLAKQEEVDFLLAVGGGSTLDTAKAIAFAAKYPGEQWWDLFSGKATPADRLPVGSIHTITAAGSETSTSCVILDDIDAHKKVSCGGPLARPVFAILNPELTVSVSPYQTGAGTTDVFAHTLERYFYRNDCTLGDEFAQGLMRTVVKYGPIAYQQPENYEARAELMLCGAFSHNDITGIGHSGKRGGPHGLESIISATFDTAHGAGLAVIMPAWLQFVADDSPEGCARVAKLAIAVFGVSPDLSDLKGTAYEGIRRFRQWLASIGMPRTLGELGVKESDIPNLVAKGRFDKDDLFRGYTTMTREQMTAFYRAIL